MAGYKSYAACLVPGATEYDWKNPSAKFHASHTISAECVQHVRIAQGGGMASTDTFCAVYRLVTEAIVIDIITVCSTGIGRAINHELCRFQIGLDNDELDKLSNIYAVLDR